MPWIQAPLNSQRCLIAGLYQARESPEQGGTLDIKEEQLSNLGLKMGF